MAEETGEDHDYCDGEEDPVAGVGEGWVSDGVSG